MTMQRILAGGVVVGACATSALADLPDLVVTPVGGVTLSAGDAGAGSLSGLSYVGDGEWLAISDNTQTLFRLNIAIDPATGAIASAAVVSGVTLAAGVDLEGVAYDPVTKSAWISDESGPAIRRHDLTTGAVIESLTLPAVFANARPNFSLESLTRDSTSGALWTANEEALSVDGPLSSVTAGTVVRVQKFDDAGAPAGQWAYMTQPISADSPFITQERSGVADLVALPDGRLLVLERELGGSILPDYHTSLFLVNFDGATDVSSIAGLDGAVYTPVSKQLLWEGSFAVSNFEGIALGPKLEGGSFSLILVSDDGADFNAQQLFALRISGVVPEPAGLLPGMGFLGWAFQRRRMK